MSESAWKKIEAENRKILDEYARSQRAFKNSLNNVFETDDEACIVVATESQPNCLLDSAWDAAKSFVSGIIWIFVILCIIGFIFG